MINGEVLTVIDEAIKERIEIYFNNTYKGISHLSFSKYLEDTLSLRRANEELVLIRKKLPIGIENKKLLEIGCGFCSFTINAIKKYGIDCYGIEPDLDVYSISKLILFKLGISSSIIRNDAAENLSFNDAFFDIVYSSNVLEHTQDPQKVFSQSLRVLKPGGYLFFVIPNYASWWDGHYGIIWLPNIPRNLAKFYVKILGRDAQFLDTLQLITLKQIEDIAAKSADVLEILDWGWDVWEHRLATLDFSGWAELYKLKKILKIFQKLHLVKLIIGLGKRFDWLTPIIVVGKKKK